MKKKMIALAVSAGLVVPGFVNAMQVVEDKLEIYGKAHISIDAVSAEDAGGNDVSNTSIASNSSRLGFKGKMPMGSLTGFYTIESKIVYDESGSTFASRNTYVGLQGAMGSFLVGYRDTPFKDVRGDFDIFGDTVGDARNIMGSINGSDKFNVRAQNVLMYTTPKAGDFQANLMYSTAEAGGSTQGQDNNDTDLTSINLVYKSKSLLLSAAWEDQSDDNATGIRLVGAFDVGPVRVGLMYEDLDHDTAAASRRSALGANVAIKAGENGKVKVQYLVADDNDATTDSGATNIAVGYDHKLDKSSTVYVMYSSVSNDTNASFGIGGGHDSDKYSVGAAGQDVSAISLGYIYSF
jgi:predicted porin